MIKEIFKLVIKYIVLFVIDGLFYIGIEFLWRGRTDITYFLRAGLQ